MFTQNQINFLLEKSFKAYYFSCRVASEKRASMYIAQVQSDCLIPNRNSQASSYLTEQLNPPNHK